MSLIAKIPIEDLFIDKGKCLGHKGRWKEIEVSEKTINTTREEPKMIIKEVAILRQVSHKNIVSITAIRKSHSKIGPKQDLKRSMWMGIALLNTFCFAIAF